MSSSTFPEKLLQSEIAGHPYPILFATVSGAHLYGFPSPDSDYDLRGVHILPAEEALGLFPRRETVELSVGRDGVEVDYVTHDAYKFFGLLLKRNGYVLEQLYSPLLVAAMPEYEELKAIARGCVTRNHLHHYLGFLNTELRLLEKEEPTRIKPILYAYRVALTGIHLLQTGEVQANLVRLNEVRCLPEVSALIECKMSGSEHEQLDSGEKTFHLEQIAVLLLELESAGVHSNLPHEPTARPALHDLLVRLRLTSVGQGSSR